MIIINVGDFDQKPLVEEFIKLIEAATYDDFKNHQFLNATNIVKVWKDNVYWLGPETTDPTAEVKHWISIYDIDGSQVNVKLSPIDVSRIDSIVARKTSEFYTEKKRRADEHATMMWNARNARDHEFLDQLRQRYSDRMAQSIPLKDLA